MARRSFLACGHYRPLVTAIGTLAYEHLADILQDDGTVGRHGVLDIGCGEGYYLNGLRTHLDSASVGTDIWYLGMDIAKDAVRLAAKRGPDMHFAVADINATLPFVDESMVTLLNIFAPHHPREFARILAPTGLLIVVIPTLNHLAHLRATLPLLGIEKEKQQQTIARFSGFFEIVEVTTIEYEIHLTNAELLDLVRMMPTARHLTPTIVETIAMIAHTQTAVGFDILAFRKMLP